MIGVSFSRLITFVLTILMVSAQADGSAATIFAKDNLVAWCIVPFDAAKRGPVERARLLKRLGITRFAYDWRAKDIPTFDEEIDALNQYGIRLQAFWATGGPEPMKSEENKQILELLKRRHIQTQIWYLFLPPAGFDLLPYEQKLDMASRAVAEFATAARGIGCFVGLYNHGGWFGEPENQIAIIEMLKMNNVGMVYNFHHGHAHMDRFAAIFPKMLPYLMSVNLNGMSAHASMILPLGAGNRELDMIRIVKKSGYRGPIGVLGHDETVDAEVRLRENLVGLQKLLRLMGDEAALKTY